MNVFDWLSNMDMPVEDKFDVVEVRFKNGRKDFYRNSEKISLTTGDAVIVEAPTGHHLQLPHVFSYFLTQLQNDKHPLKLFAW